MLYRPFPAGVAFFALLRGWVPLVFVFDACVLSAVLDAAVLGAVLGAAALDAVLVCSGCQRWIPFEVARMTHILSSFPRFRVPTLNSVALSVGPFRVRFGLASAIGFAILTARKVGQHRTLPWSKSLSSTTAGPY
jgi:hypothetical protein